MIPHPNERYCGIVLMESWDDMFKEPEMNKYWKIFWWVVTLIIGLVAILIMSASVMMGWGREERARAYMMNHNCQVVGYAGRGPVPYYQCDNGRIMLKTDMYYLKDK
jgi:hypothetical protein